MGEGVKLPMRCRITLPAEEHRPRSSDPRVHQQWSLARPILNSFLQMIEQDASHSLIVAATNHPGILDHALLRRFDDILHYTLPDDEHIAAIFKSKLSEKAAKGVAWQRLAAEAKGLSYAELVRACYETLKEALMKEQETVSESDIHQALRDRCQMVERFNNKAR